MIYLGLNKIGKVYLGNNSIGKVYYGSEPVFTAGSSPTPPTPTPGGDVSDYVQSGLVLHLDAIEPGNNADAWSSIVGDIVFNNHGAIFQQGYVEFDGSGYFDNTDYTAPGSSNTIEVVCDMGTLFSHSFPAFMPKNTSAVCFLQSTSGYIFRSSGATNRARPVPTLAKASFSLSSSFMRQNGETMATSGSSYATRASSTYNYIGRGANNAYAIGKIYSIRIYNRELTEEEVLSNLSVDNIRFNLGL